jgi:hypothetical protein
MSKNFQPVEKEQLSTWQLLSQFRYMHEKVLLACQLEHRALKLTR